MLRRILFAAAVLAAAAGSARAQGAFEGSDPNAPIGKKEAAPAPKPAAPKAAAAPKGVVAPAYGLSDEQLDSARSVVDRQLEARKASLQAHRVALDAFLRQAERDRAEAERVMAEERKAFLLYLKAVPGADRADAMKKFEERQEGKRKELDKAQLAMHKKWFGEAVEDQWKSQPLAAEPISISQAASVAESAPASAPEVAAAKPAKQSAPVVRKTAHKRKSKG